MTNPNAKPGLLDRFLSLFSDVRAGEAGTVLLMLFNLFLLLASYYIIKTVREPLILATGGAEMKSYAAAVQALLLMGFVPFYSWFADQVNRRKLILGFTIFFIICIQLFFVGGLINVPYLGFVFYVWVGIFSLAMIAQFWSLANDMYSESIGKRLFPVIAIGATAGSPVGSWIAGFLFEREISPFVMMQIAAVVLVVHLILLMVAERKQPIQKTGKSQSTEKMEGPSGFTLVIRNRYILLIATVLILLNLVNTTGEYILGKIVTKQAHAHVMENSDNDLAATAAREVLENDDARLNDDAREAMESETGSYIGSFYGNFFFWVNIITLLIQAFLVSRIVKYLGMAGIIFALPVIALGVYTTIGLGAGLVLTRWLKTAENSTDYSVMNTARAMLWLPTTREEKYKAKQAVDTFFYRVGDLFSAGLVFVGSAILGLGIQKFAFINVGIVIIWLGVTYLLLKQYQRLSHN